MIPSLLPRCPYQSSSKRHFAKPSIGSSWYSIGQTRTLVADMSYFCSNCIKQREVRDQEMTVFTRQRQITRPEAAMDTRGDRRVHPYPFCLRPASPSTDFFIALSCLPAVDLHIIFIPGTYIVVVRSLSGYKTWTVASDNTLPCTEKKSFT